MWQVFYYGIKKWESSGLCFFVGEVISVVELRFYGRAEVTGPWVPKCYEPIAWHKWRQIIFSDEIHFEVQG